ncbi:NADH-quinone oxidoreductase subunit NuoB [Coprothermobacteraceae bacterium]|nr:NADH-quinone oxidoreductase subunit NuoB [Coprothermobacteraceae bacterium]
MTVLKPEKSLWIYHLNTGSCNGCDIEILAALTPKYDAERFGVKLVGSPRHADIVVATGPVTAVAKESVLRVLEQVPDPKAIVVTGVCGITGGVFRGGYSLAGPLDTLVPVDVYVLGCPPKPEGIMVGIIKAAEVLELKRRGMYTKEVVRVSEKGEVLDAVR